MSRIRAVALAAVTACLTLAAGGARADIYAYVDDEGQTHFSDAKEDGRYKLFLKTPEEYKLKPSSEFRNVRKPGDYRLRAPHARIDERDLLDNPALDGRPYQEQVVEAAKAHKLDPALIHAVIAAESNYNPNAVSNKGAVGLMQIMPDTGRRFGVKEKDLKTPDSNIRTGSQYLAELIAMFNGDLRLALASYNAGENAVIRHGRKVPPFAETQAYVPRVLRFYEALRLQ